MSTQNFRELVEQEKGQAREANGDFHSMHEMYGALAEEVAEFFDLVRLKPAEREPDAVLSELVQIAAVVEMSAEDMYLVEKTVIKDDIYKKKYEELLIVVSNFLDGAVTSNLQKPLQPNRNNDVFYTDIKSLLVNTELYNKLCEATSL